MYDEVNSFVDIIVIRLELDELERIAFDYMVYAHPKITHMIRQRAISYR